jgi:hypothetical protein
MTAQTSITNKSGNLTVTGATGVATLLFDGTVSTGFQAIPTGWLLEIQNLDADAGDTLYYGYDSTVDTTNAPQLDVFSAGNHYWTTILLVPTAKLYVNCTNGETRDVRFSASPLF